MRTINISEEEYKSLKKKASIDEELLKSLIRGLEDIKAGRVKDWVRTTKK